MDCRSYAWDVLMREPFNRAVLARPEKQLGDMTYTELLEEFNAHLELRTHNPRYMPLLDEIRKRDDALYDLKHAARNRARRLKRMEQVSS